MERALRAARVATFVYFVLDGTLMGMWLVQIPAIEKRVGISHATLGSLLVLLGVGAFFGMQLSGRLADRLGTRVVVPAAGVLCAATLVLPGLAREPWTLAGALLVFGFCNGCLDVSMNAHAVHVEKAYNRPIMSAFHATFSVGGVIAALVGAQATSAGLSPAATLAAAGGVGIVIALVFARSLLPTATTTATATTTTTTTTAAAHDPAQATDTRPTTKRRPVPRRIWILAALAMMCMLCEGVANDWSAVEAKNILGASASTASFAYGTYAATMTIGRLLADRVSARFGSAAVLRYGAATGAVGLTIVAISPWIWSALIGWAIFGIGLSGCVPQLFSAAGHTDPAAGTNVSRVAGLGYLGMLAGPALIGWMTRVTALGHTFLLPALLLVVAAATAGILRTGSTREAEPEPELAAQHL
ncbi:MFS transporter [Catenulispora sp. NF23]|uniref:MFS transporter n=1 Tax=Catenulispora pinistramenti TaxID=2705254 RepID=UPI001BA5F011|nr:MFS transporter [Catenulispora pinistramenti]MBS2534995.1 MFS transporter [Catenulispora pinistramenti]